MNRRISTIFALAAVIIVAVILATPGQVAYAIRPPTPTEDPCQRHGDCRPDPQPTHGQDCEEHGNNDDGNEDHCAPTPTEVPTYEPTQTPTTEPTATSTDEPTAVPTDGPTATPTSEPTTEPTPTDVGPTPTEPGPVPTDMAGSSDTPVVPDRLPETGDGSTIGTWACWQGANVICAHNGVEGGAGEQWVFLYAGSIFTLDDIQYVVLHTERVPADDVSVLDDAGNYDLVLLTCTNYQGGTWIERFVVFAELSQ